MAIAKKDWTEHTSYEVRKRWNQENYTKIGVDIWKDDAKRFKEKCKRENVTQASILKDAIYKFLGD